LTPAQALPLEITLQRRSFVLQSGHGSREVIWSRVRCRTAIRQPEGLCRFQLECSQSNLEGRMSKPLGAYSSSLCESRTCPNRKQQGAADSPTLHDIAITADKPSRDSRACVYIPRQNYCVSRHRRSRLRQSSFLRLSQTCKCFLRNRRRREPVDREPCKGQ